jgi:hypothetical protein
MILRAKISEISMIDEELPKYRIITIMKLTAKKKGTPASPAMAFAKRVLPVPGGPAMEINGRVSS